MPITVSSDSIPGVRIIEPDIYEDDRGNMMITYEKNAYHEEGIRKEFIQDKQSRSAEGVLRGLHYQLGDYAQTKLVRCNEGSIFDVVVDLRRQSPTFQSYSSYRLSDENKKILYLPKGLAHGFLVMSGAAEVHYKLDSPYEPGYEAGIVWNDSALGIDWPIETPILSEKDQKLPTWAEAERRNSLFKYGDNPGLAGSLTEE